MRSELNKRNIHPSDAHNLSILMFVRVSIILYNPDTSVVSCIYWEPCFCKNVPFGMNNGKYGHVI
jgi:hypothetical protein